MLVACVLLAGCGGEGDSVAAGQLITPAAIAAIVQEHVALEPRRMAVVDRASQVTPAPSTTLDGGPPGVWLQYADVTLEVVVTPIGDGPAACAPPTSFDECVDESVDGHDVTIAWQELEPEEDPGTVYVIDRREAENVAVQVSGPPVTDDPRNLDLGVPLPDLAALATDPRLSLTTSQSVVDLGADVTIGQP